MHLDSLTIKNFRVLEDIHVKKLGHVNLIVGKNNSGKSTVLEALALLASGYNYNIANFLILNRQANKLFVKVHSLTKQSIPSPSEFFDNQYDFTDYESEISIGNEEFFLKIAFSNFVESNKDEYIYLIEDEVFDGFFRISSSRKLKHLGENFNDYNGGEFYDINMEMINTNFIEVEKLADEWEKIVFTDDEKLIIEALQKVSSNIINFAFLKDEKLNMRVPFVKLSSLNKRTPLHEMGDGVFRILQIILKVLKAKDGFLLIDEFENGLHYSVQPDVWRLVFKLAKEFNIQVFATTHSWDCIESFAEVAKESELDGVLFRLGRSVRKSDNGKVIATEFDEDELYNMTKMQMEVR